MIDRSILAQHCAPEASNVALPVRLSDLWTWTFEAVERSTSRGLLIDRWARAEYRDQQSWRDRWGLTSVTHELMTRGLRSGEFALRVHDGTGAWRLPAEAFQGWKSDVDLEMTWTTGRLWQFDTTTRFHAIASLDLPLLTTEAEADRYRRGVQLEIAEVETNGSRSQTSKTSASLRQQIEEAASAVPEPDPGSMREWVEEWSTKVRWPLREALLWVAFRDVSEVARTVLASFWSGHEHLGIAGATLAQCDIEQRRTEDCQIERRPADLLMQKLAGSLKSYGLSEGDGPMTLIGSEQWENLEFGVPPESQRGTSDAWQSSARVKGQVHGVPWRGHWTGIKIDRADLFSALPPIAAAEGQCGDSDAAVDATILRLSRERGSPLPRNNGAAIVQRSHPSRSKMSIRKRIEALFPHVSPGPKSARIKRAD